MYSIWKDAYSNGGRNPLTEDSGWGAPRTLGPQGPGRGGCPSHPGRLVMPPRTGPRRSLPHECLPGTAGLSPVPVKKDVTQEWGGQRGADVKDQLKGAQGGQQTGPVVLVSPRSRLASHGWAGGASTSHSPPHDAAVTDTPNLTRCLVPWSRGSQLQATGLLSRETQAGGQAPSGQATPREERVTHPRRACRAGSARMWHNPLLAVVWIGLEKCACDPLTSEGWGSPVTRPPPLPAPRTAPETPCLTRAASGSALSPSLSSPLPATAEGDRHVSLVGHPISPLLLPAHGVLTPSPSPKPPRSPGT